MHIFEVIFWGSRGDGNAEDTIYLVRARDFRAAVDDVERNASPRDHDGKRSPRAEVVYQVGTDLGPLADFNPGILRGPYFAFAYNRGWRSWHRNIESSDEASEWVEQGSETDLQKIAEAYRQIHSILLRQWNPMGVEDVSECQDLYRNYVQSVYIKAGETKSVQALAEHLVEIELDYMGLPSTPGPEARSPIALQILKVVLDVYPRP